MAAAEPIRRPISGYFSDDLTLADAQELLASLPEDVARSAQFLIMRAAAPYLRPLATCESPIEMRMALTLPNALTRRFPSPLVTQVEGQWSFAQWMALSEETWRGPAYRTDFMCSVWRGGERIAMLAVECDGHEFHERTKEQVRSGHKRDHVLRLAGIETVHLSGSEITRNPLACGQVVAERLATIVGERMEGN